MKRLASALLALVATLLVAVSVSAQSDTNQMMGRLGYAVGTELTIDGTFKGGKNSWIVVNKVNGKDLPSPITVSTAYLADVSKIPTGTVCQLRGVESTYVITPVVNPQTGEQMQQAASGRHFDFKVIEVIAPEGVKIREDKEHRSR